MSNKEYWIDTRLSQEEMDFLWDAIGADSTKENHNKELTGNISRSGIIEDKDNWFYESTLEKLTERMFYDDWNNYRKYHIVKEHPPLKFEMDRFWVNVQHQYEFNPLHHHSGLYSFVVFMKIPTHSEEQHKLDFGELIRARVASDFVFVRSEKNDETCIPIEFPLSPEDKGRMLFFPAFLQHMVYPFYGTEEERITISGNIDVKIQNRPKMSEMPVGVYGQKKHTLKMMENYVENTTRSIEMMKKELKEMEKEREKEEQN